MGTWSDFCRELEQAGAFLDRPESPDDEIDRAEGLRYLTQLLRGLVGGYHDPRSSGAGDRPRSHASS